MSATPEINQESMQPPKREGDFGDFTYLSFRLAATTVLRDQNPDLLTHVNSLRHLAVFPRLYGMNVEVYDAERSEWLVLPPEDDLIRPAIPDNPNVVVTDPLRFMAKYRELRTLTSHRTVHDQFAEVVDIMGVWANATRKDFLEPEAYLEKLVEQAKDQTFEEYTSWTPIGEAEGLNATILFKRTISTNLGQLYELNFAISSNEAPTPSELIPLIRYGIEGSTATIYETQMPYFENLGRLKTLDMLPKILKEFEEAVNKLKTDFQNHPAEMELTLGTIPSEILQIEDPEAYLIALVTHLKTQNQEENFDRIIDNMTEKQKTRLTAHPNPEALNQETLEITSSNLFDAHFLHIKLQEAKLLNERSVNMRRLNSLFKKEHRSKHFPVHNIPPGPVLATGLFIVLAHAKGVRKIEVPARFPLMGHSDRSADERISQQTMTAVSAVAAILKGITITQYPEANGSFYLELDEELDSENSTFSQAIQAINNL
jgi:hypothetical protein